MTDEELTQIAEKLFLQLDREEAAQQEGQVNPTTNVPPRPEQRLGGSRPAQPAFRRG